MPENDFNDQFVMKYSKLVYASIRNRLKSYGIELQHDDILDIVQDAFTAIFEGGKLKTIRNPGSIPYWIAIVSGNAAIQHVRVKRRIEPEDPVSIYTKDGENELFETLAFCGLTPPEELDKDALSAKLDAAFESLPDREKLIIKMNLIHDKKYEEISAILGVPLGTISNYIKRAKEKLRRSLEGFL